MERLDLMLEEVLCPASMDGFVDGFGLSSCYELAGDAGHKAVAILLKIGRNIRKGTVTCTVLQIGTCVGRYSTVRLAYFLPASTVQLESTWAPAVS